jgi:hypothetical protein
MHALDSALRKLGSAVAAAIVQRDDLSALAPIEDDRLAEQPPLEQLAIHDLMVPAAHVPAVLQEHLTSPGRGLPRRIGRPASRQRCVASTPTRRSDLVGFSGKFVQSSEQWTGMISTSSAM